MPPWKDYQQEAAEFFRLLGLSAQTDVTLQGIRTQHDIDVLVKVPIAGFEVRWIVECKHWKASVPKLHVFGLRDIVSDLGADRGIILSETGFQSGAIEAANLTNVQLTSLAALKGTCKTAIFAIRLRNLYDRVEIAGEKYWDIPKDVRIEKGLRFEVGNEKDFYSGARVVEVSKELLIRAFRDTYPIQLDRLHKYFLPQLPESFNDHEDVVTALEPIISDLETRLAEV